jgi:ribosomal protein S18 acetylase RimI-like enzyme
MGKTAKTAQVMKHNHGKIVYTQSGVEDIDFIVPLWLKLRTHHKERSLHFKDDISRMTWETRKTGLLEKAKTGTFLVSLAKENDTLIGYCVSSINSEKQGEVESIYIEKEFRNFGIGDHFMKTALKWMDDREVQRKIVGVAVGNEEAFGFYEKYGFYPRVTVLRQISLKNR